jgi:hypothetical protein
MGSLLIASAPGWCKVYVLETTAPDYELVQTLSAEPPCFFGSDLAVSQNMLFVGNSTWYADGFGINGDQVGQVHVFSLTDGQFIEETPLRVNPPVAFRRLGKNLAIAERHLFVTGEDEVFVFDLDGASTEPSAASSVGPTVGPSRMSLDAKQGTVVVAQTGVNGLLTILDQNLVLQDTIQDSSPNFGTSLRVLSESRLVTNRLGGLAVFDRVGGSWTLTDEVFPSSNITGFGFSLEGTEETAWIGSAAGFVSSLIEGGEIELDVVVDVADENFFQPARSFAAGNSKSAVFVGFPSKDVSQSKHDLLLHVDFDVVLKRDGFE